MITIYSRNVLQIVLNAVYCRLVTEASADVRSKKIRFGPGDTIGGTAPLIMMRDIDGYQPRKRRTRRSRAIGLLFLLAVLSLTALLIVDGVQRGTLSFLLP